MDLYGALGKEFLWCLQATGFIRALMHVMSCGDCVCVFIPVP